MQTQVEEAFKAVFGSSRDTRCFFAPGRVNLIGEYTDFNGGHVLPCALTQGTYASARKRADRIIRLYSVNFLEVGVITLALDYLGKDEAHQWANYPKGVISTLLQAGCAIDSGFEIVFGGSIPNGAGLSSSASIEVVTAAVMNGLFQLDVSAKRLALLAQQAENDYIGVNCGIMDQFAVVMGRAHHAVLLNTHTLDYRHVPLQLKGYRLVIANTNKQRGLADSKYNVRFAECREALADLQTVAAIQTLGDLDAEGFLAAAPVIRNPDAFKRARHAVFENLRTLKAADVLKTGDLKGFGELMNASHRSLQTDFEVSCPELDLLVDLAQSHAGVLGARLTGAGFGGCTVNLVAENQIESFIEKVGGSYMTTVGYRADFYMAEAGDGAMEIV